MLSLCLISTANALNGNILTANSADYSEPVQTITRERRASFVGSVVNDWREYQWTTAAPSDVVEGSATISAYAVDYYGTNFETWVSIYATGGGQSDSKIFDYGWTTQPLNDMTFPITASSGRTIKVIFRYRYSDSAQNPPASNMSGAMRFWITWEEPVNYSQPQTTALPDSWLNDTTQTAASSATYPTTTIYDLDNVGTDIASFDPYSTIYQLPASWLSFQEILGKLTEKMPWVIAVIGFTLVCSVLWWLLK